MQNKIISAFYSLDNSIRYTSTKDFCKNILENSQFKYKKHFDFIMIFLVLSTIATLIYEVNHPEIPLLIDYEYFAVGVFALEWLARLWVYSDVRKTFIKDYEETLFFGKEDKL